MVRRLLYPPGVLALYLLLALARIVYWPVQIVSPSAAKTITDRVEWWHVVFTRWCLAPMERP